jgi:UDP-N-acetylglucosamine 3-dehydrogenase
MTEDRPIRVAVIGVGTMGQHHARIYSDMKNVTLVGVADIQADRAQSVAGRFGSKAFKDSRTLFEQRPDAVSIAVPTSGHLAVAIDAIQAGCSVLLEKPIAATREEADQIIAAAEAAQVTLMVGHVERFNPAVLALRRSVKGSHLISLSMTRVGPIPPRVSDVGIIVDLGVHDIDLAHYLTGAEFSEVVAFRAVPQSGREDTALMMFRMANGVLVQIMTNWLTPYKTRRIQAAARELLVDADLITQQVRVYSDYQTDGAYAVREVAVRMAEPLRVELEAFVDAVARRVPPPVTGLDGRRALDIALRAMGE